MPQDTLTITDNRTGQNYTLPVENGTIRAMDLRKIKTGPEDFGLMTYDPAFMNTASCRSAITFIDGDKGILRYRGYPIDVLAQHCTYLEVAYRYQNTPGENELRAIDTVREVYGIQRIQFNEKESTVRVLFDASRMKAETVAKLLRQAGIDVREQLVLA